MKNIIRRAQLRAERDAYYARFYGLTGDELRYILDPKEVYGEDFPYIFDRFWRKEKSRSRTTGGTGLGLAIAKQLIEAQGGTIEARNLSEGGLQISIAWHR